MRGTAAEVSSTSPGEVVPDTSALSFSCVYCAEEPGPRVGEHLESCYREAIARRNERLEYASVTPLPDSHRLSGGSPAGLASATEPAAALISSAAIGRQLLSRHIAYYSIDAAQDPHVELAEEFEGRGQSPSRLDLLYKELARQSTSHLYRLEDLNKEEAAMEMKVRRDWMGDDLGPGRR